MGTREGHGAGVSGNTILDRKPMRVFQYPLTINQQIWLGFLVPAIISAIIFIANFSLNVAVVYQLCRIGHLWQAGVTLSFMYAPAIFCLIVTFIRLPQLGNFCDLILWVTIQILQCVLFPIGIMHRFSTRLFWSAAALTDENTVQEESLQKAGAPHQSELFLFMNSFLNAAPQSIFQTYLLLSQPASTSETAWTQGLNVVTSVIALSIIVTQYQRFESQRAVGRPKPWTLQCNETHSRALVHLTKIDPYFLMGIQKYQDEREQIQSGLTAYIMHETHDNREITESVTEETAPVPESSARVLSETPPSPTRPGMSDSSKSQDEIIQEPEELDALLSTKEANLSETLAETDNLDVQQASITQHDSSLTEEQYLTPLPNPTRSSHSGIALPMPIRKPRTKGLDEDEPLGLFTAFHAWLSYLLARVLVIATFAHFYAWPSLGLILGHYAVMVSYLCFCSPCLNYWIPLLGLIHILSPLEVNVRYKYPKLFLISYFVLVLLEDISTVLLWYIMVEWNQWYYDWIFYLIASCHGMAALNFGLYFMMSRPKTKYLD